MEMTYESMIAYMTMSLKESIESFSVAQETYTMEPLFCVSNKQFLLLKNIAHFSNHQVLNGCRQLCIEMCKEMRMKISEPSNQKNIDFILEHDGKTTGLLISLSQNYTPDVSDEVMRSLEDFIVVVLQEAKDEQLPFYQPNNHHYKNYKYKNIVRNITMKQFFDMIGRSDYKKFKEYVERYNYEAEQLLGMTVSAIPTKKALTKHKLKIKEELLSYYYEEELQSIFLQEEISDMKKWFEKNIKVLLSEADFSKSFISSEWYYNLQVMTDGGIEQTAIIAGYLKSLEQLLCSILLVLSDDNDNAFMLHVNKEGKEKTGKEKLPLTRENQKLVLTMAKNILKAIKGKKKTILRKTKMTDRVISYLEQYVEDTRNGYMHKDNLYEWSDIQKIRTKTYCVYFIVLGTFKIDVEKLSHIND